MKINIQWHETKGKTRWELKTIEDKLKNAENITIAYMNYFGDGKWFPIISNYGSLGEFNDLDLAKKAVETIMGIEKEGE